MYFGNELSIPLAFGKSWHKHSEKRPLEGAVNRLQELAANLGDLQAIERGILVDLFLSYRDVSAWNEMTDLYDKFPANVKDAVICRQQLAFISISRLTLIARDS